MSLAMNREESMNIGELEQAIQQWESAVERIAKGWDNIEEYTHDLQYREDLEEALSCYSSREIVPEPLLRRIATADDSFREATVASRLCVWHCGPQFRHYPNGHVELLLEPYDQETYWYYYRWQPDCPYSWREHDGISYQREIYGLDFENMSVSELEDAVRRVVARWHEKLQGE